MSPTPSPTACTLKNNNNNNLEGILGSTLILQSLEKKGLDDSPSPVDQILGVPVLFVIMI